MKTAAGKAMHAKRMADLSCGLSMIMREKMSCKSRNAFGGTTRICFTMPALSLWKQSCDARTEKIMAEDERPSNGAGGAGDVPERLGNLLAWIFIAGVLALFLYAYIPRFFG